MAFQQGLRWAQHLQSFLVRGLYLLDFLGPYLIPFSAIIGSASVIIILFVITKGFGYDGVTYMLLAGIAVNAIAGVGIGVLTYISDDSELRSLTFWTMGSFGGVTWPLIMPAILVILFSIVWIIGLSRKLDLIQLGDVEASRLGINIKKSSFRCYHFLCCCCRY